MSRALPMLPTLVLLLACCASGNPAPRREEGSRTDTSPPEVCTAVMRRTRDCADTFVPGLMALRVRLDLPPGIKARFEAEGEKAMVALAHEQFARDWSDEAIARNCKALAEKPADQQERIVAPDRRCLQTADCRLFTECDLAHKEERWKRAH